MKLAEYLEDVCIRVGASAADKEEAVRIISKVAKQHPLLKGIEEQEIFSGFMEREKVGSTGFSSEIAIPHFATDSIDDFVVGVVTMPEGVDYRSLDGKPTRLFVFVIAPQSKRDQHLGILSSIARFFRQEGTIARAVAAATEEELRDFILAQRTEAGAVKVTYDYNLISVTVQAEDLFQEILDIFTEAEGVNLSVFEAENAGKYLYNMPLFASFWASSETGFHRIINGTVRKTSTNQILQKLNSLVENMKGKKGVMISIIDLIYKNGSLDI